MMSAFSGLVSGVRCECGGLRNSKVIRLQISLSASSDIDTVRRCWLYNYGPFNAVKKQPLSKGRYPMNSTLQIQILRFNSEQVRHDIDKIQGNIRPESLPH